MGVGLEVESPYSPDLVRDSRLHLYPCHPKQRGEVKQLSWPGTGNVLSTVMRVASTILEVKRSPGGSSLVV